MLVAGLCSSIHLSYVRALVTAAAHAWTTAGNRQLQMLKC